MKDEKIDETWKIPDPVERIIGLRDLAETLVMEKRNRTALVGERENDPVIARMEAQAQRLSKLLTVVIAKRYDQVISSPRLGYLKTLHGIKEKIKNVEDDRVRRGLRIGPPSATPPAALPTPVRTIKKDQTTPRI